MISVEENKVAAELALALLLAVLNEGGNPGPNGLLFLLSLRYLRLFSRAYSLTNGNNNSRMRVALSLTSCQGVQWPTNMTLLDLALMYCSTLIPPCFLIRVH